MTGLNSPSRGTIYIRLFAIACLVFGACEFVPVAENILISAVQAQEATTATSPAATSDGEVSEEKKSMSLLLVIFQGGWLVIPIVILMLVAVFFAIERLLALRQMYTFPEEFRQAIDDRLIAGQADPLELYRVCEAYPTNSAAETLKMTLLKTGRTVPEMETAMRDAADAEAARLYKNVRPLNLSAAVAPLLGLLGTVWGMIQAFFHFAESNEMGMDKVEELSSGIYTALVTTFVGLCVAIPSAIVAHYFEGRILSIFANIESLARRVIDNLEPLEGSKRLRAQDVRQLDSE